MSARHYGAHNAILRRMVQKLSYAKLCAVFLDQPVVYCSIIKIRLTMLVSQFILKFMCLMIAMDGQVIDASLVSSMALCKVTISFCCLVATNGVEELMCVIVDTKVVVLSFLY